MDQLLFVAVALLMCLLDFIMLMFCIVAINIKQSVFVTINITVVRLASDSVVSEMTARSEAASPESGSIQHVNTVGQHCNFYI